MSFKPLLAATLSSIDDIKFPVYVTVKIDGIRAIRLNSSLVSRTLKNIPNQRIRSILTELLPEFADGEIVVGDTFQSATSAIMTSTGSANFDSLFTYYWFDLAIDGATYSERMEKIKQIIEARKDITNHIQARIVPLLPILVHNKSELEEFEKKALSDGYEGVMIRSLDGKYKMGRSTMKEGILIKMKRFADAEAKVIGFEELEKNDNTATKDAFGHTKRSQKKDGMIKGDTLGALIVENDNQTFKIGSGFDAATRREIWDNKNLYLNKQVKYKYFEKGIKIAPRFPIFLGFRKD